MFEELEKELEKKFTDSKFKIINKDGDIEIYYSNREFQDNDDIIDDIFDVCEKYLSEEQLWHVAILYDYFEITTKESTKLEYVYETNIQTATNTAEERKTPIFKWNFEKDEVVCSKSENINKSKMSLIHMLIDKISNTSRFISPNLKENNSIYEIKKLAKLSF